MLGSIDGALPGGTTSLTMVVVIPFSFWLEPVSAKTEREEK